MYLSIDLIDSPDLCTDLLDSDVICAARKMNGLNYR